MRISDWSSDVCSSDLSVLESHGWTIHRVWSTDWFQRPNEQLERIVERIEAAKAEHDAQATAAKAQRAYPSGEDRRDGRRERERQRFGLRRLNSSMRRSEEHTSELQSLMRISYAVFCLKKKNTQNKTHH